MPTDISEFLGGYLRNGPLRLGQVRIFPDCRLCHLDDSEGSDLANFTDPHDAIEIARYDDAGNYRPLKTAPNLRHGWQLRLKSVEEVTLALDFLYPAALGTALAFTRRTLNHVDLRQTLARQTGMYAVTKRISDEQADATILRTCNHEYGCIRRILWSISPGHPTPFSLRRSEVPCSNDELPILCAEACNLLVAAARKTVKSART
jgi:sirohydrochlorin cobaltochelatase